MEVMSAAKHLPRHWCTSVMAGGTVITKVITWLSVGST